ncbi:MULTISPECIES: hypothetical protein [Mycobacterium]|uniref:hypothetical protein n=1 Tax=Mycobacterium TaxID=1763 RepID=UPI001058222A|nr:MULTISPECIES: hypothetical protein [Mycobacterium]MDM4142592.1 hypothetical protein [Mycobacterium sp. FLAC0960]
METVAGVPGLSSLLAWPTDHLAEAAAHWEAVAERSYGVANQVWRDALSVDWQGEAAEALRTATHSDMMTASAAADQLQRAAKIARSGASDLHAARSRVRYAVVDAHSAGFEVSEDLSVTDRMIGGSADQRMARQAQAQALADDLRQRAAQLMGLDRQVAGELTAAVAGVGDKFPHRPPAGSPRKDNHVRAVDNHWKEDPPPPAPDPRTQLDLPDYNTGTLSAEEARTVYAQGELRMRQLNEQLIKQGLSPEARAKMMFELRNSLRSWTRELMADRGLADQLNATQPNKALDELIAKAQANGLKGDSVWNSIIESSTRSRPSVNATLGVDPERPPPLPPVRSAPAAPAPIEAPVQKPPVVEAPPPRTSPRGGPMIGGVGPDIRPHFIPPPHAHPHWLGETPEEEWEDGQH